MSDNIVGRLFAEMAADADVIMAKNAEIERLRAEVEQLTQLHERIAASDDVAKAYQQVYFEDFPTVKQAAAETLLAKEQLAAERAEVERLQVQNRFLGEQGAIAHANWKAQCAEVERLRNTVDTLTNLFNEQCDTSDRYALAANKAEAEAERLMDGMELASELIATGHYWDRTNSGRYGEWNEDRAKWRVEHWRPALERNREARRER